MGIVIKFVSLTMVTMLVLNYKWEGELRIGAFQKGTFCCKQVLLLRKLNF